MKIKTNLRAGAKSGTVPSGNGGSSGGGSDNPIPEGEVSVPVVTTTRCAGL